MTRKIRSKDMQPKGYDLEGKKINSRRNSLYI